MILHDRVDLIERVQTEVDRYGNPVYEDVPHRFPAEVVPLGTSETIGVGVETVETRYRIVLAPVARDLAATRPPIVWQGTTYQVEGDVELHSLHGRLHHLELIARRAGG